MSEDSQSYAKLKPCAMGSAMGVLWGVSLFITALIAGCCGNWGGAFMSVMSSVYIGYDANFIGALAGLGWGLVDGFIGGFIFAWLYNLCCCCSKCASLKCKC